MTILIILVILVVLFLVLRAASRGTAKSLDQVTAGLNKVTQALNTHSPNWSTQTRVLLGLSVGILIGLVVWLLSG